MMENISLNDVDDLRAELEACEHRNEELEKIIITSDMSLFTASQKDETIGNLRKMLRACEDRKSKLEAELVACQSKNLERKMALLAIDPFEMFTWCPWCSYSQMGHGGHAPDCIREKALEDER